MLKGILKEEGVQILPHPINRPCSDKEHFNAPYTAIVPTQPPSLYFSGKNIIKLSTFSTSCCRKFTYSWMLRHVYLNSFFNNQSYLSAVQAYAPDKKFIDQKRQKLT